MGPGGRLHSLRPEVCLAQEELADPEGQGTGGGQDNLDNALKALPASSKVQGLREWIYFCLHQNLSLILFRFNLFCMNLSNTLLNSIFYSYNIL